MLTSIIALKALKLAQIGLHVFLGLEVGTHLSRIGGIGWWARRSAEQGLVLAQLGQELRLQGLPDPGQHCTILCGEYANRTRARRRSENVPPELSAEPPRRRSSTLLAGQAFESGLAVSPVGLFLAAGFAIGIGLGAGVYPALKASRLHPVDAIRAG